MKEFAVGDKAVIVQMPPKGQYLVGEAVVVLPIGGPDTGVNDDDVVVRTETGVMLFLKEHQLGRAS